ncbi:hypothetical protein E4U53_001259, partial [Claviceps sorghi]
MPSPSKEVGIFPLTASVQRCFHSPVLRCKPGWIQSVLVRLEYANGDDLSIYYGVVDEPKACYAGIDMDRDRDRDRDRDIDLAPFCSVDGDVDFAFELQTIRRAGATDKSGSGQDLSMTTTAVPSGKGGTVTITSDASTSAKPAAALSTPPTSIVGVVLGGVAALAVVAAFSSKRRSDSREQASSVELRGVGTRRAEGRIKGTTPTRAETRPDPLLFLSRRLSVHEAAREAAAAEGGIRWSAAGTVCKKIKATVGARIAAMEDTGSTSPLQADRPSTEADTAQSSTFTTSLWYSSSGPVRLALLHAPSPEIFTVSAFTEPTRAARTMSTGSLDASIHLAVMARLFFPAPARDGNADDSDLASSDGSSDDGQGGHVVCAEDPSRYGGDDECPSEEKEELSKAASEDEPGWSAAEDFLLRGFKAGNVPWADIAVALGRSRSRVEARWEVIRGVPAGDAAQRGREDRVEAASSHESSGTDDAETWSWLWSSSSAPSQQHSDHEADERLVQRRDMYRLEYASLYPERLALEPGECAALADMAAKYDQGRLLGMRADLSDAAGKMIPV